MNKEELQKKCANLIGVSTSEKELAFQVLQEKILAQLKNDGDALRIHDLGVFQFKTNKDEHTNELIFSPSQSKSGSKTLFLRLPVPKLTSDDETVIEDIFSLSVGKPIVPLNSTFENGSDSDSSFVLIKKKIEERVNEILSDSELLINFDLWDNYLKSMKSGESKDKNIEESSAVLNKLTEPDPEPEQEIDSFTKSQLSKESEQYSFPKEKETPPKKIDEKYLSDYETFKNLMEEDEEKSDDEIFDEEDSQEEIENIAEDISSIEEENEIEEEHEPLIESTPEDEPEKLSDEDIFDLEKTVFNSAFEEGDKVDWNWGDELEEEVTDDVREDEEPPVIKKTDVSEKEQVPSEPEEKIEEDPFGTLEKTLEQDPEFLSLTNVNDRVDDTSERDNDYRITNLTKPREVPPKPKTRMTRLTTQVEEETPQHFTKAEEKEKEEVYKSFRDRNSNNNVFVIAGIIIILAAIIYFAFSMGDEPSKDIIKPTNQASQTQSDENIVTTEPPSATVPQEQQTTSNNVNSKPDNTSKVEEIRVSNLIFRRGNEYNVQVSSWRSSIKADAEVKRLKAKGYDAFVVQAYLPSKGGTWHRVRIGGFKTEQAARNFLNTNQL